MLNSESSTTEEDGGSLPSLPHAVSTSLARLHFLNAYRWSVQPNENMAQNTEETRRNGEYKHKGDGGPDGGDDDDTEEYRVRWQGHGPQVAQQVARLEQDTATSDVTLQAKGAPPIYSHRLVLAAASPFFCSILQNLPPGQHPVIVVWGASGRLLRQAVSFCYTGVLTLPSRDIPELLKVSEELEITGLTESLKQAHTHTHTLVHTHNRHPRPFRPPSPTRFPFTPPLPHGHSPPVTPKRSATPLDLKEGPNKKRVKVEPREEGEGENSAPPHSSPLHHLQPPGSAPPFLDHFLPLSSSSSPPTPSFSPPNSAPPQSLRGPSPLSFTRPHPHPSSPSLPSVSSAKQETEESLRLVPAPRLLPPPHFEAPDSTPSQAPLTPSTPSTPSTPGVKTEGSGVRGGNVVVSGGSGSRVLLWRFLLDLLHDPRYTPYYIRWLDRSDGVFRIMESDMVAQLWGMARKNSNMNYEKMSRGMRTYYKRGILFHIDGTKLIYRFNINEPDIQQRMRFYDLTQRQAEEGGEQPTSSYLPSPVLPPVTSSESTYSPLLSDAPPLSHSILYYPYLSLLGAAKRELY